MSELHKVRTDMGVINLDGTDRIEKSEQNEEKRRRRRANKSMELDMKLGFSFIL